MSTKYCAFIDEEARIVKVATYDHFFPPEASWDEELSDMLDQLRSQRHEPEYQWLRNVIPIKKIECDVVKIALEKGITSRIYFGTTPVYLRNPDLTVRIAEPYTYQIKLE